MPILPPKLFGLTLDDIPNSDSRESSALLAQITRTLKAVAKAHPAVKPIVRVVFDFDAEVFRKRRYDYGKADFIVEAKNYRPALEAISAHAWIMGEVVDSSDVFNCHYDPRETTRYVERTEAYAEILGHVVDIWEIGNEINGEWVGWQKSAWADPSVTVQQMAAMRRRVQNEISAALAALKKVKNDAVTAVTFYFNDDHAGKHSWSKEKKLNTQTGKMEEFGHEYGMFKWAEDCRRMFQEVNYIFISYYEDDNYAGEGAARAPIIPDASAWAGLFKQLHEWYPQAKVGFGEVGPQCYYLKKDRHCELHEDNDDWGDIDDELKCERSCDCCKTAQEKYVNKYYGDWDVKIRAALATMTLEQIYAGGYFYWHFEKDVVKLGVERTLTAFQTAFGKWY